MEDTRIITLHKVSIMVSNELAMQGTRASAALLLTQFAQNILVSAPQSLKMKISFVKC